MAKLRIGKDFLDAGFVPVTGGDAALAMGSALLVFLYRPFGDGAFVNALPMLRVRVGKRVTILEKRAHGTPTGRCSRGHWERVDDAPTPQLAADWRQLGRFWSWRICESVNLGTPSAWDWSKDHGKDRNRCGTQANSNALAPTLVGGQGRGRTGRGLPSMSDAWGFSPASGSKAGTHDARKVNARVSSQNRIDAAIRREFQKDRR